MNEITVKRTPDILASEINYIKEQTRNVVLFNSIEIGKRLVEAKNMMEHGQFGKWLEESVSYSRSTANNLMRIYEEYGADQGALFGNNSKSETLGNLTYTQAVMLLGIPREERETFVKENEADKLSVRELQKKVREYDEKLKKMESEINKAGTKAKELSQKLVMAKNGKDLAEGEAAKAKAALSATEKKIDELMNELNKPVTVETQVIEKIPENVEKELQELRQAAKSNKDAVLEAKYKVLFDSLKSTFNDMMGLVNEFEDVERAKKYRGATEKILRIMVSGVEGKS